MPMARASVIGALRSPCFNCGNTSGMEVHFLSPEDICGWRGCSSCVEREYKRNLSTLQTMMRTAYEKNNVPETVHR